MCYGKLETAFIFRHVDFVCTAVSSVWQNTWTMSMRLPGLLHIIITRCVCSGLDFWLLGWFTWHVREQQDSAPPCWPGNPTGLGSSTAEKFQVLFICTEGGLRETLSGVQEVARLWCRHNWHSNAGSNQHSIYILRQLFMSMPHW